MNRETLLAIGCLLYGSLYTALVAIVGLATHHHVAAILAVVTAGLTYLSYFGQLACPQAETANRIAVGMTIFVGAFAGLALL
jgi:hypothetical protein